MEEKTISITKDQLRKAVAKATYGIARYNPLLVGLGEVVAERLSFELFGPTKMPADGKQTGTLTFNEMLTEDKFDDEIEEKVVTFKKKEPKYKLSRFEFQYLQQLKENGAVWIYRSEPGSICVIGRPIKKGWGGFEASEQSVYSKEFNLNVLKENNFSFLDWEKNEEATLIDDILNDCEVIDNE